MPRQAPRALKLFIYFLLLFPGGLLLPPLVSYATLTLDSTTLSSDSALNLRGASSSAVNFPNASSSATALILGGDTSLYRGAASQLKTESALVVSSSAATLLQIGRSDAGTVTPDFKFGGDDWQLYVRALIVSEIGDTPNINLRRVYPDSGAYSQTPAQVPTGVALGFLGWQAHDGASFGTGSGGSNAYTAQIYSRTVGAAASGTNRGGSLHLATTNQNDPVMAARDRILITDSGKIQIQAVTNASGTAQGSALNLEIVDTIAGAGLTIGGDTNLYRSDTDRLKTDSAFHVQDPSGVTVIGVTAGNSTFRSFLVSGDANEAIQIGGDGKIRWGAGGASTLDTNLYRSAAATLKTDHSLHISSTLRLLPQASAPSSPGSGDMYMDSTPTPDELCVYDGSAWQALITGTDANCA